MLQSRHYLFALMSVSPMLVAVEQYSLVLPQTLFQPIGSTTAMQAGASYASGDEAAAGWYNPANLSWISGSSVSASANAYGLSGVRFEAGNDSSQLIGGNIFKYYGGYADAWPPGEEQPRADAPRFALVFANPMSWSGRVNTGRTTPTPTDAAYGHQVNISQRTWGAAALMSWRINARWSVGAGLVGLLDQIDIFQSNWRHTYSGNYLNTSESLYQWSASLRPSIGTRWQATNNLALGLALQLAPMVAVEDGTMTYAATVDPDPTTGSTTTINGRNDDDPFRFVHPPEIGFGCSWSEAHWQIELAMVYLLPPSEHTTIESIPTTIIKNVPGNSATTITGSIDETNTTYRHVLNWRLGGRVQLTNALQLHTGIFYDQSPVESSEVYDRLDFVGGSVGMTLRRGHSIFALGINGSFSNYANIVADDLANNRSVEGTVNIWTVDALIGTGYRF